MTERDIFLAALDVLDSRSRADYLNRACHGNADLRARVEALLQSHDSAGSFLGRPAGANPDPNSGATMGFNREVIPNVDPPREESLSCLSPPGRPDSLGKIGHYEILEVLGRGAFGIVFRAFDEKLHRMVAVKILIPELAENATARKRFVREARAAAAICHEHVVNVYAVDERPVPYLVMEYVCGQTLQAKLDRGGPVELKEVLRIGQQIAEGLAAAHAMGLVHRDVKPANILLENGVERVKISDFGLARTADDGTLTQSGVISGTPMYMAPEQAQDEAIDHRADLFSLGSVLYVMCTGRPPFRAPNTIAVLKRVCEEAPRPIREINPAIPAWLCDIIGRLHEKNPDDRFASAREVADQLGRCLSEFQRHGHVRSKVSAVPVKARPGAARGPAAPRYRYGVVVVAAFVLLGLIGLSVTEANGVTNLRGTVIRLFSPDGTLVIEVDDPGITVTVDGEDTVITGAGAKEIRLKPGQYKVKASKDGKPLREELVRVETNGKQVVRVSREVKPGLPDLDEVAWGKKLVTLPAEEQIKAVVARLHELNPEFELTEIRPRIEADQVTGFEVIGSGLRDLSPVRSLPALRAVGCVADRTRKVVTPDLTPLKEMNLSILSLRGTDVVDVTPLVGLPLVGLELSATKVTDLSPLRKIPLKGLHVAYTPVKDLSPLHGMKLDNLNIDGTQVEDLGPIKGQPLTQLNMRRTRVSDLSPLKGMPLVYLDYIDTPVTDISPLKDLPLKHVECDFQTARDAEVLRSIKSLETINRKPVEEFWRDQAGQ